LHKRRPGGIEIIQRRCLQARVVNRRREIRIQILRERIADLVCDVRSLHAGLSASAEYCGDLRRKRHESGNCRADSG
jgi:hypothetical protein